MIRFNSKSQTHSELSNFYLSPFALDGRSWLTVEHYYQAHKFLPHDEVWAEAIRHSSGPGTARRMGRSEEHRMRDDWDDVRDIVMMRALRAKFGQDQDCMWVLLDTGDEELVEHTPWGDFYWGDGGDGTGKNRLGILLMELRASYVATLEVISSPELLKDTLAGIEDVKAGNVCSWEEAFGTDGDEAPDE